MSEEVINGVLAERYTVTVNGVRTAVGVNSLPGIGAVAVWCDENRFVTGEGETPEARRRNAITRAAVCLVRDALEKAWHSEAMPEMSVTVEKLP